MVPFACIRGGRAPGLSLPRAASYLAAAAAFALLVACGGSDAPEGGAAKGKSKVSAETERRISELETQLAHLTLQSEGMRRETTSRLDQIDATKQAMLVQVTNLREELLGNRSALPPPPAASEQAAAPVRERTEKGSNAFVRLVLLMVIFVAIAFIARIFFGRWGVTEDGEPAGHEAGMTNLGRIRVPPSEPMAPSADADDLTFDGPRDPDPS